MKTITVLWSCEVHNVKTSEEAAQKVVDDLYRQLASGGSVPVEIRENDQVDVIEITVEVDAQ